MKKRLQTGLWAVLALGGMGMLLRFWLFTVGTDERGLLNNTHVTVWLCYVLTALMAAAVVCAVLPLNPKPRYHRNFPASPYAAAGSAAAALALGIFGILSLTGAKDGLDRICGILALLAAAAMAGTAWFRFQGRRVHFACGTVVCVFFMLTLYSRYRQWSSEPQLIVYFYAMLALVCSMIAFYYRTALDGNIGRLRPFLGLSLTALYFCFLAIPGSGDWLLYLGLGAYFAGELLAIRLPRRSKASPEQEA